MSPDLKKFRVPPDFESKQREMCLSQTLGTIVEAQKVTEQIIEEALTYSYDTMRIMIVTALHVQASVTKAALSGTLADLEIKLPADNRSPWVMDGFTSQNAGVLQDSAPDQVGSTRFVKAAISGLYLREVTGEGRFHRNRALVGLNHLPQPVPTTAAQPHN